MHTANDIGSRIQKAREAASLNQREMGAAIGCTNNDICRYENGRSVPSRDRLVDIAKALGVSPGWLMFGETEAA